MAASDRFSSVDDQLKSIRDEHTREMKDLQDQLLACQIELRLTQKSFEQAQTDRSHSERLLVKLITQFANASGAFSMAQKAFDDANRLALAYEAAQVADGQTDQQQDQQTDQTSGQETDQPEIDSAANPRDDDTTDEQPELTRPVRQIMQPPRG